MKCTREQIISEYKKLKLKLGRAPKSKEFYKETGITQYHIEIAFGSNPYTKIQQKVGDEPRKFGTEGRGKDEYFRVYGEVVRNLKNIPTISTWRNRKVKPRADSYRKVLNIKWSKMPPVFIDWAINKMDWEDVVKICINHCRENNLFPKETETSSVSFGYVYLMKTNKKHQYKLGKTDSPEMRANQLSQLHAHDLSYEHLQETNAPYSLENYWKLKFKGKKVRKELYKLTQDDIKAFKEFYVKKAVK